MRLFFKKLGQAILIFGLPRLAMTPLLPSTLGPDSPVCGVTVWRSGRFGLWLALSVPSWPSLVVYPVASPDPMMAHFDATVGLVQGHVVSNLSPLAIQCFYFPYILSDLPAIVCWVLDLKNSMIVDAARSVYTGFCLQDPVILRKACYYVTLSMTEYPCGLTYTWACDFLCQGVAQSPNRHLGEDMDRAT